MVGNRIIGLGFVALGADAIALGNELIAVWGVAVATYDARLCHFALHERAVYVDLVANLAVVPVQRRLKYRKTMRV